MSLFWLNSSRTLSLSIKLCVDSVASACIFNHLFPCKLCVIFHLLLSRYFCLCKGLRICHFDSSELHFPEFPFANEVLMGDSKTEVKQQPSCSSSCGCLSVTHLVGLRHSQASRPAGEILFLVLPSPGPGCEFSSMAKALVRGG